MQTRNFKVEIVDYPEEAQKYGNKTTLLVIKKCVIVGKGTINGLPTVDIQMQDESGKKFLVMATGRIIEMLAGTIVGKRERDQDI